MRAQTPAELIKKYQHKGVLLDTNLLLLFLVGTIDSKLVSEFKPTSNHDFTIGDYDLLCHIMGQFKKRYTTPHILTEVSNHSDKLKGKQKAALNQIIVKLIDDTEETYETSKKLCREEGFSRLGLTDTAILDKSQKLCLVLTVDWELAGQLAKNNMPVINFNNIRGFERALL